MPTPPNTGNYGVGGAILSIGGFDFGNVVSMEIDASDLEVLEHFTSRSGARQLDLQVVTQKKLTFTFEFDEHQADVYRQYFMGGNVGATVDALTVPLAVRNISLIWRNEAGTIWTFSHTRCQLVPSGAMDFGEFDDWATMEAEVRILQDLVGAGSATMGRFTFAAYP